MRTTDVHTPSTSKASQERTEDTAVAIEDKKEQDAIEEICQQLKHYSIEYLNHLNNMLGVSLIDKNPEEALKCWSACTRSAKAVFNMAVAYETGKLSVDGRGELSKAFEQYQIAAELGHKYAIYNLALFYLNGRGVVSVDTNKADTLLRKAAKMGVVQAQEYVDYKDSQEAKPEKSAESASIKSQRTVKSTKQDTKQRLKRNSSSVPNFYQFGQANMISSRNTKKQDKERTMDDMHEDKKGEEAYFRTHSNHKENPQYSSESELLFIRL